MTMLNFYQSLVLLLLTAPHSTQGSEHANVASIAMSTGANIGAAITRAHDNRPISRCQTEHRRCRLHQLLERETLKTPLASSLLGVKSLPSLPIESASQHGQCPSPVLTRCKKNLSPLRTHRPRPQTRLVSSRTARQDQEDHDGIHQDPGSLHQTTNPRKETVQEQIAHEALLARETEDWERRQARQLAKQYKAAQLEQIQDKQQRRRERKLDGQQIAEQIEWEQTQLEFVAISQRMAKQSELYDLKEAHLHSLEVDRRRASASKIATHFFERLAALEAAQAMQLFENKQDELVRCCMELMQDFAERDELDLFKEMMRELLQREELLLRHRLRAAEREGEIKAAKAQAVVDLKRSQYEEIQRHNTMARHEKANLRVVRSEIARQQELLDDRYSAMQETKKQRSIALSKKLQEKMRRNRAEEATVSLQISGKSSPMLWTPFWSDESSEARVEGFQRTNASAVSPERPVIFAKKSHHWYD